MYDGDLERKIRHVVLSCRQVVVWVNSTPVTFSMCTDTFDFKLYFVLYIFNNPY